MYQQLLVFWDFLQQLSKLMMHNNLLYLTVEESCNLDHNNYNKMNKYISDRDTVPGGNCSWVINIIAQQITFKNIISNTNTSEG